MHPSRSTACEANGLAAKQLEPINYLSISTPYPCVPVLFLSLLYQYLNSLSLCCYPVPTTLLLLSYQTNNYLTYHKRLMHPTRSTACVANGLAAKQLEPINYLSISTPYPCVPVLLLSPLYQYLNSLSLCCYPVSSSISACGDLSLTKTLSL